jgi:hypothetical protein
LLLLLLLLLLQVLFIDRHDQLRARLAAGLFEKVCAWACVRRCVLGLSATN